MGWRVGQNKERTRAERSGGAAEAAAIAERCDAALATACAEGAYHERILVISRHTCAHARGMLRAAARVSVAVGVGGSSC